MPVEDQIYDAFVGEVADRFHTLDVGPAQRDLERFNRYLIAAAKRLPTYLGADMDAGQAPGVPAHAARAAAGGHESAAAAVGGVRGLARAAAGRVQCAAAPRPAAARRARRRGAHDARRAWSHDLAAADFAPLLPSAAEADDLFRPYELRVTRRGEVSLWGRAASRATSSTFDGQDVLVGYDIHDASRAWVRDLDERLVAIAGLDANVAPLPGLARRAGARGARAPPREAAAAQLDEVRAAPASRSTSCSPRNPSCALRPPAARAPSPPTRRISRPASASPARCCRSTCGSDARSQGPSPPRPSPTG